MAEQQTTEGIVARTNEGGFSLEDEPRDYYNYSKNAEPPPPKVEKGDHVRVTWGWWKEKRWANAIDLLKQAAPTPTNGATSQNYDPKQPGSYAYRDLSIQRQSATARAIEFMEVQLKWLTATGQVKDASAPTFTESDLFSLQESILMSWEKEANAGPDEPPPLEQGDPGPQQ